MRKTCKFDDGWRRLALLLLALHHGEGDLFAVAVDLLHPNLHRVSDAHHVARVLDEAVGQFGDVHEAVLVHAHVDKGAKVDDVAHGALEFHAGFQVIDGKRRAAKDHLGRVVAWVAAGFLELVDDVDEREGAAVQVTCQCRDAAQTALDIGHAAAAELAGRHAGALQDGRRLFLLFCWLFCIIVIAAFTDMVCKTFMFTPAVDASGAATGAIDFTKSYAAGCAGTISILFTFVAIAFGWAQKKFNLTGAAEFVTGVVLMVLMFAVGMQFPVYLDKFQWFAVVMVYLVFAGAMPIQMLKTPRDYLTSIMMIVMIVCAVLGIVVLGVNGQATITAPVFTGFSTASGMMFPVLFVSVACGALSGFHSLVSSGTSSKQVEKEQDAVKVGYGAMIVESFVGILAIIVAGIMFSDMNTAGTGALNAGVASTPFQIFAAGISRGMQAFGVDGTLATVFMTMNVSALALTSLDAVARIARTSFSEFFAQTNDALAIESKAGYMKVLGNPWFATVVTLLPGLALAFGGYANIWPLFGASNQLLGGMTMITLAVFCKCTGRKGWMLYVPVAFLLCCTFTSLVQSAMGCMAAVQAYGFFGTIPATATTAAVSVAATKGLQLVFAVLLMVLGLIVAVNCLKEFFGKEAGSMPDEEPEWSEMGKAEYGRAAAAEAPADAEAAKA